MFSRYRSLVILAAVLLFELSLLAYQFRQNADVPLVRHGTIYLVTPVQKGLRAFTDAIGRVWWGYVDLRDARRQNQELVRERDRLQLETQGLRKEVEQARRLQALVDFRRELPPTTLVAPVIGSSGAETSQTVILGKGRNAGLQPDMPVLTPAGIVGKVLHVFPTSAQALLLTDANSGVACLLESSRIHGILRGKDQPLCRLAYVANGEKVEIGERVLTSGEDRIYPKGLPVGIVVAARPGPEFQEIEVRPFAPLNRLEEVLVITKMPASEPETLPQAPTPSGGADSSAKSPPAAAPETPPQPESPSSPQEGAPERP